MTFKPMKIADLISEISMGPFGSNIKVECFVDEGIPVLNGSNLEGFALKEDAFRYVTPEKADFLGKANAGRGDVVITHRGTLGQIVFIPQNSLFDRYVISQSQFRVKCNDKILPEYLVYYFHTRIGQHKLLSNASQVGVPALARASTTFKSIEIEVPDIDYQNKVVDFLETIRRKIAINCETNQNLSEQIQSIYQNWFGKRVAENDIPEDWHECCLNDVCSLIVKGITPKYDDEAEQRVINQKCIRNHEIDLSLSRKHRPKVINEKWLNYGDLLINSTGEGTLGRAAQVLFEPINLTVDSHITIVRPNSPELIGYIGVWGITHEYAFTMMSTGSTGQTDLPRERLKAMDIIIPSVDELLRFNDVINPMNRTIIQNRQENERLSNLRDLILPRLMSGELDVSEIEI